MESKKFGVIGYPIKHSMSALMHNAAFKELKLPHSYELFEVSPEDLELFMKDTKLNGLNATIPHKVAVLNYIDKIDKTAELIGATNTIKFDQGKKIGYNTDGIGCIKALNSKNVEVKDKRVLVLGAGGAARAIIFQLSIEGAKISIFNRTKEKAVNLIQEVKEKTNHHIRYIKDDNESLREAISNSDILINSTSVGMHPNIDKTPILEDLLHSNLVIMDIVYNPIKTKLLKLAEKKECKTIDGVDMLVYQGAEALRIWLGIEPPIRVMRNAVIEGLKI